MQPRETLIKVIVVNFVIFICIKDMYVFLLYM